MRAGISFSAGTDVSTHCAKNVSAEARGPRVKYGSAARQTLALRIAKWFQAACASGFPVSG